MALHIKLSTSLREYVEGYNPLHGLYLEKDTLATPIDVASKLGIPLAEIKIIMVNGQHGLPDSPLKDNDRVAFFPAVGGG